jgi:hypothetical protein
MGKIYKNAAEHLFLRLEILRKILDWKLKYLLSLSILIRQEVPRTVLL